MSSIVCLEITFNNGWCIIYGVTITYIYIHTHTGERAGEKEQETARERAKDRDREREREKRKKEWERERAGEGYEGNKDFTCNVFLLGIDSFQTNIDLCCIHLETSMEGTRNSSWG